MDKMMYSDYDKLCIDSIILSTMTKSAIQKKKVLKNNTYAN